ncbi:hypothetical protein H5410_015631 [Solanum commersonii]|uniref:Uncharacterized protein n=1 Tax=Solanum commersonii TaxID=4109 RepID=A0A9J5ZV38_SOLCO|nr:hypothetical protein H5410_015631 [Solanum commersonii]
MKNILQIPMNQSKEIQKEEENSVHIIETEEDNKGYTLKATFDVEILRKIEGLKLNLKIEDNLLNKMQRIFARNKISYHEYQEIEKVIEITQTTGKHKLNLLTKPMIDQILRKIPEKKRKNMNYVHLGGIQILVKSTFKEGINCPIVINLQDERFINAREENLGIIEGNLAYNKLLFTNYPKYCISLKDADFNEALSLHFQIKRIALFKPGNQIMKCSGIARIVEVEIQNAQISEEYEIEFGKSQEIGSTSSSNSRLSIDYGRNSIRKSISNRYPKIILENPNMTRIMGRIYNGTEWKSQEMLIQIGATTNHLRGILINGLQIHEGNPYNYKTFEGNNFSCKNMINLPILLDTIRITVPCYITNHESGQDFILGNLFLNSLEDYSIGKNENMNEFLLLCEHLDTRPKRNSSPEGNINPKKLEGNVPLAPSAKNISSVSLDMTKPESSDKGKSKAIKKDDKSKIENSNKVSLGTKVFSSFQVGRQHPKDEQYLAFTKLTYNLPEESGETFGVLSSNSLFPRISIFPNGFPGFTAQLFEFGYLDRVYAKAELKELSGLPNHLVGSIKNNAQVK